MPLRSGVVATDAQDPQVPPPLHRVAHPPWHRCRHFSTTPTPCRSSISVGCHLVQRPPSPHSRPGAPDVTTMLEGPGTDLRCHPTEALAPPTSPACPRASTSNTDIAGQLPSVSPTSRCPGVTATDVGATTHLRPLTAMLTRS
jgi:hypothetical protein